MAHARLEPEQRRDQDASERSAPGPRRDYDDERLALIALRRDLIEDTVAQVFGVHAPKLQGITRGKAEVAQARQVAMYLTHTVFGLFLSDTGRIFERDRTTVAHACSVIEDMRDDPVFDRVIELLESVIPALVLPRVRSCCSH